MTIATEQCCISRISVDLSIFHYVHMFKAHAKKCIQRLAGGKAMVNRGRQDLQACHLDC